MTEAVTDLANDKARVVLGVTGSIACYKALDLASKLGAGRGPGGHHRELRGDPLRQLRWPSAASPTGRWSPIIFDPHSENSAASTWPWPNRADIVVIAPATVHLHLQAGRRPDRRPPHHHRFIATAGATPGSSRHGRPTCSTTPPPRQNLGKLRERGITVIAGPADGSAGFRAWSGPGRLLETPRTDGTYHLRSHPGQKRRPWRVAPSWSAPGVPRSPSTRCG